MNQKKLNQTKCFFIENQILKKIIKGKNYEKDYSDIPHIINHFMPDIC